MSAEHQVPRRKIDYSLIRGGAGDEALWVEAPETILGELAEEVLEDLPVEVQTYLELRRDWIAGQDGLKRVPFKVEEALRRRAKELVEELKTEEGL